MWRMSRLFRHTVGLPCTPRLGNAGPYAAAPAQADLRVDKKRTTAGLPGPLRGHANIHPFQGTCHTAITKHLMLNRQLSACRPTGPRAVRAGDIGGARAGGSDRSTTGNARRDGTHGAKLCGHYPTMEPATAARARLTRSAMTPRVSHVLARSPLTRLIPGTLPE